MENLKKNKKTVKFEKSIRPKKMTQSISVGRIVIPEMLSIDIPERIIPQDVVRIKYEDLTGTGTFHFRQMTQDIGVSLKALGLLNMTVSKQSDFYVWFANRTKKVGVVLYGIGIYVVMKVTCRKGNVNISTYRDIAAAAHLNLLKVELVVKTFGLRPSAADLFFPDQMSNITIDSVKYFDSVVANFKNLNNDNTVPEELPQMFTV